MSSNKAWETTSKICKETAKGASGTKEANQKSPTSKEVQESSSKQKKLIDEVESNQNKQKGSNLKRKETRSPKSRNC